VTPAGGSDSVTVEFDASGLADGDYDGLLEVRSNDPTTPTVTLPVALHVGVDSVALAVDLAHHAPGPEPAWITATTGVCDPESILAGTVVLAGEPPAAGAPVTLNDCEAVIRFDRASLVARLGDPPGDTVAVELIGENGVSGWFRGRQVLTWLPPAVGLPPGPFSGGADVLVSWSNVPGTPPALYDVWWSPDSGATWSALATGLTVRGYSWTTPFAEIDQGRIEVVVRDSANGSVIGIGLSGTFQITTGGLALEAVKPPLELAFTQQGPRPARGAAHFQLALPERREVEVSVYDVRGARLRRLASGRFEPGRHTLGWDGTDATGRSAGPGIYFVRVISPGWKSTLRVVLLR
jgi:hypothetical protein